MQTTVIITGSSSGFGKLIAKTLLKQGYKVIATMRDPQGKNEGHAYELSKIDNCEVLELDVQNNESVHKCIQRTLEISGKIDVVINNAGIGVRGLQESFSIEQMNQVMDVNVNGPQRVNQAVLPSMRKNKSGLLIQVSSTVGRFIVPYCGPYAISKYAVEAMAETYRYELAPLRIDSTIIEPGGFMTNFADSANWNPPPADGDYENAESTYTKMWTEILDYLASEQGPNPQLVADSVLNLIRTPFGKRPLRTVVDPGDVAAIKELNQSNQKIATETLKALELRDQLNSTPEH